MQSIKIIVLLNIFFFKIVFSQIDFGYREIYVKTIGNSATIDMSAVGRVWGHDFELNNMFCEEYSLLQNTVNIPANYYGSDLGFDNVVINCFPPNLPPFFGYGLYKLSVNDLSFYVDFRDDDYDGTYPCGNDFYIIIDSQLDKIIFRTYTECSSFEITQNTFLSIFSMNGKLMPSTSLFENFWQNCLVIIPSQTGNQPRLVWGPHPNITYNNGFNVYRAIVSPGQPEPAEGNFALLTPNGLSNSTFTYTDGDINLGTNNNSLVYYFVKAKGSGSTLSSKTNTVDIDGRYIEIEKKKGNEEIEINNFSLSQNHPNPFNPTTSIVYQIATSGIVNLSVYNLLGEKVAMLVNDYKEAGEYTVQFNASGLPSGTYIYTLATNGNRISKKLSVMK